MKFKVKKPIKIYLNNFFKKQQILTLNFFCNYLYRRIHVCDFNSADIILPYPVSTIPATNPSISPLKLHEIDLNSHHMRERFK